MKLSEEKRQKLKQAFLDVAATPEGSQASLGVLDENGLTCIPFNFAAMAEGQAFEEYCGLVEKYLSIPGLERTADEVVDDMIGGLWNMFAPKVK